MLDGHDLVHIASYVAVSVAGLVKLSRDRKADAGAVQETLQWLKKWCQDHETADRREFDRLDEDVRELRTRSTR